ncbi:MAG: dephospho-CoA kinase [Candidatus Marinimicrobia bacterium]|jgi:dephospho-CoA kinase|nr:dephospho-CoA kinase [Candidatus Neomarinimicrobiota bacterium]
MYKLGITGGIGAGKSTTSEFFRKKGAFIFDADSEAKNLLINNSNLNQRIIATFGSQVTTKKQLDLKRLSALVFSSCSLQNKLNNIVWPEVLSIMIDAAEKAENDGITLFIVDAALLIEAGFNDFFNSILLITAEKSIRYNRILLRKKIPENQIEKRMALQMAESEKQKQAQTTIKNNGNIQELHTQLELFWKKLNIS